MAPLNTAALASEAGLIGAGGDGLEVQSSPGQWAPGVPVLRPGVWEMLLRR